MPSKVHWVNTNSMCMGPSPCKNCWNVVKMCPGSLLEICLVGFIDTLMPRKIQQIAGALWICWHYV